MGDFFAHIPPKKGSSLKQQEGSSPVSLGPFRAKCSRQKALLSTLMGLPRLPDLLWRAFPSQTEMENGHPCKHADQFSGGSVLGMRVKLKVGKRSHVECPVSMCHLGNLCAAHGGARPVRGLLLKLSAGACLVTFG